MSFIGNLYLILVCEIWALVRLCLRVTWRALRLDFLSPFMVFKNFAMKSLPWICLLFCLWYKFFFWIPVIYTMHSRGYMWRYFVSKGEKQLTGVMGWAALADVGGSEVVSQFCSLWEEQPFRVLALPHWVCQAGRQWQNGDTWSSFWTVILVAKSSLVVTIQSSVKTAGLFGNPALCLGDTLEHMHCLQRSRILVSLLLWRTRILATFVQDSYFCSSELWVSFFISCLGN